ncbi:hypothetical protein UFOVP96_24 [uncultured Caudovirales phage]|uniref:Uncharacterized protein n=1 Tax=uncultured Caudovirales phage TaxID=2100421 RepID=A0A6J5L3M3_9CAUD|nr:hypothetical protein UFOVP96_24 [uncultured Caudovirales phage]
MLNIELYAKHVNGEIDIKKLTNPPPPPKPDIELEYYIYKMIGNRARMLASTNGRRTQPCNVTIVFDGNTGKLKTIRIIDENKNENI